MKKVYLVLIAILSLSYIKVNAQVFTQGDVTVMLQPSGSHDTNNCSTMGQLFYNITVNNSFIGDSVKIKEMGSGTFINSAVNSTGQNPWIMMLPVYNGFGFATDDQVSGGVVFFGGTINKVISGTDTVYNIGNGYVIPVPNPCQYANMTGKVYVDYNNDCSYNGSDQPLVGVGLTVADTLSCNSCTVHSMSASPPRPSLVCVVGSAPRGSRSESTRAFSRRISCTASADTPSGG